MNPNPGTMPPLHPILFEEAVRRALLEDLGRRGDITTDAIVAAGATATARMVVKTGGRIAGIGVAGGVFHVLDPGLRFEALCGDGADVPAGATIAVVRGSARSILSGERTALNFLAHMSGIATATREIVGFFSLPASWLRSKNTPRKGEIPRAWQSACLHRISFVREPFTEPYKARVVCTRKTTPGLRTLEKYAVRAGGGFNHRFGLDDAVLIKDNHIVVAGGVAEAINRVRQTTGHMVKVEVEVDSLEQLETALTGDIDAVLLDNMTVEMLCEAVRLVDGRVRTEASGGITPQSAGAVAASGVDLLSMGWLTHSVPALDVSLDIEHGT